MYPSTTAEPSDRYQDVPESPVTHAAHSAGEHSAASEGETVRQPNVTESPVAAPVARDAAGWVRDDSGRLIRKCLYVGEEDVVN